METRHHKRLTNNGFQKDQPAFLEILVRLIISVNIRVNIYVA